MAGGAVLREGFSAFFGGGEMLCVEDCGGEEQGGRYRLGDTSVVWQWWNRMDLFQCLE